MSIDAFAAQGAAIRALEEADMPLDKAWQRTIEIVRTVFPWSVVEPHARALVVGSGALGPVA